MKAKRKLLKKQYELEEAEHRLALQRSLFAIEKELFENRWPHLSGISIPAVNNSQVELLIGQDSPGCLVPQSVISGRKDELYAVRTNLDLTLNGPVGKAGKQDDLTSTFAILEPVERYQKIDSTTSSGETAAMSVEEDLLKNFSVDDSLSATLDSDTVKGLVSEALTVLPKEGCSLSNLMSHSGEFMESIPKEENVSTLKNLNPDALTLEKAIGVMRDTQQDVMTIGTALRNPRTKNDLLDIPSSLFEPLGVTVPSIIHGCQIVPELFRKNIGSGDEIPKDLEEHRQQWIKQVRELNCAALRCAVKEQSPNMIKEPHFCDAPEKAYGTGVYARHPETQRYTLWIHDNYG